MPPVTGIGLIVIMNSHRFSFAAVSASASRSWLSRMFMPSAVINSVCTGKSTPSTIDGVTSEAASLPTIATPRALMNGDDRGMESGGAAADRPRPDLVAARPSARAQQDRVTGLNLHARPLLPRFDILLIDRGARLEIRHAFQARISISTRA